MTSLVRTLWRPEQTRINALFGRNQYERRSCSAASRSTPALRITLLPAQEDSRSGTAVPYGGAASVASLDLKARRSARCPRRSWPTQKYNCCRRL